MIVGGVFVVVYFLCFMYDVFFNGEFIDLLKIFYELLCYMWVLVEVLVVVCLLVGIFLYFMVGDLLVVVFVVVL